MLDLETKYFGTIQYDPEDMLYFPDGLYGFEEEKAFLLLPFEGSMGNLLCLQSVVTPGLAFVALNPFSLDPSYGPVLQEGELTAMGVSVSQDLCFYTLCVVREPIAQSTVNLKCPLVINEDSRRGMQVILDTPQYEMRHLLSDFAPGEADAPC